MNIKVLFMTLFLLFHPLGLQANEVEDIENLFKEEDVKEERRLKRSSSEKTSSSKEAKPTRLENLNELKPFENVAVIQKRFLPKTGRFEALIGAATSVNDDYFTSYGLHGGLAYHFSERWAIEGVLKWFESSNSSAANDLLETGIVTNGLVGTELYYGANIRWTPIYGKFAYFDEKIIPFDHYFAVGVGQTSTVTGASSEASLEVQNADEEAFTIHLSTGQILALTKWMAFRWDVSWHFYENTSPIVTGGSVATQGGDKDNYNNIFFSVGLSFFFPEANYR